MSSMDLLDVGQANEFKLACRRNDFTPEDLKRLCEGTVLADVRQVLLGHASITVMEHIINCDANPYVPGGWEVEEHQKGGSFKWDKQAHSKDALYRSAPQKQGSYIRGHKLREELKGKPVLNANVLDHLLAHPELIPEDWKEQYTFFFGTIYRHSDGSLDVRVLYWFDGEWHWGDRWLDGDWGVRSPAALRAS